MYCSSLATKSAARREKKVWIRIEFEKKGCRQRISPRKIPPQWTPAECIFLNDSLSPGLLTALTENPLFSFRGMSSLLRYGGAVQNCFQGANLLPLCVGSGSFSYVIFQAIFVQVGTQAPINLGKFLMRGPSGSTCRAKAPSSLSWPKNISSEPHLPQLQRIGN